MDYGGRAYYDELTERCGECGWSARDVYSDGRPYLACRLCGYILHGEPTATACTDFATPARAAELREQWLAASAKRTKRKTATRL